MLAFRPVSVNVVVPLGTSWTRVPAVGEAGAVGPVARRTIVQGLVALLHAFEVQDGPSAADLMLRFIYDAETAYARM